MVSTHGSRPAQYRAKAREAREKAAAEPDEVIRKRWLNDADLWDRMADYEQENPTHDFPSYYAKDV